MHNWPNVLPLEVAIICTAALLLCVVPNLFAFADARRRRRERRTAEMQAAARKQAVDEASMALPSSGTAASPLAAAESASPESPAGVAVDATGEIAPPVAPEPGSASFDDTPSPAASAAKAPVEAAPLVEAAVPAAEPVPEGATDTAASVPVAEAPAAAAAGAWAAASEPVVQSVRLEDLRRVKLPNWPPAAVRDNPERMRLWKEAVQVAEQPLITRMEIGLPCAAESACLSAADSVGSVLRIHFLLFSDLWPVAPEQATAEALFEVDSATGNVHAQVRSLPTA